VRGRAGYVMTGSAAAGRRRPPWPPIEIVGDSSGRLGQQDEGTKKRESRPPDHDEDGDERRQIGCALSH